MRISGDEHIIEVGDVYLYGRNKDREVLVVCVHELQFQCTVLEDGHLHIIGFPYLHRSQFLRQSLELILTHPNEAIRAAGVKVYESIQNR